MTIEECLIDLGEYSILERWDYDLNKVFPKDISVTDKNKYYFKCPRGIHDSELKHVNIFHNNRYKTLECNACKSFAQRIIDEFGVDYLNEIWDEQDFSPWDYGGESKVKAHFKCKNGHKYIRPLVTKTKLKYGCPYCSNRSKDIDYKKSLGYLYPKVLLVWSDKNAKTAYEYSDKSGQHAWFKCENGIHEDYNRQIASATERNFLCPRCIFEKLNSNRPTGEKSSNWKGGITPKYKLIRTSTPYKNWRTKIFERDNYTCQCCFQRGGKLNVHHILNFSNNEDLRFDDNNAITLCEECHSVSKQGSFHNIYGVKDNTAEQLVEYINKKRKQLGIHIPFIYKEIYDISLPAM